MYGSAKSGFHTYISGLRSRFSSSKINIITVFPGFVYTKMTQHLSLPKMLTCTPDKMANQIFLGYRRKKIYIYQNLLWLVISIIIRIIPEKIFKNINL